MTSFPAKQLLDNSLQHAAMLWTHVALAIVHRICSEHQHMREGDKTSTMSTLPFSVGVFAGINSRLLGTIERAHL